LTNYSAAAPPAQARFRVLLGVGRQCSWWNDSGILNAKSQGHKDAKSFFRLGVFATWRLGVEFLLVAALSRWEIGGKMVAKKCGSDEWQGDPCGSAGNIKNTLIYLDLP